MMKRILGLRTVDKDRRSYKEFQWPSSGKVVAPDWMPTPGCGYGLHALVWGVGDGSLLRWDADAIWQAVWIEPDKIVDLGGKIKFPECEIACDGTREEVIKFMIEKGANPTEMVGGIVTDDKSAVAHGDRGRAVATGPSGMAITSGINGEAITYGPRGCALSHGHGGQAVSHGGRGRATADGELGIALVTGADSVAVATGYRGSAKACGDYGRAIAGEFGKAVTGTNGYSEAAGEEACVSAGIGGCIAINAYALNCRRVIVGYVGDDGIKPDTLYRLMDWKLVEVVQDDCTKEA